jgi:Dyp-type peroxidase family
MEMAMARDLTVEPQLAVDDIQGDILVGLLKQHEHLMFFQIVDKQRFRNFLKTLSLTSAQECLAQRAFVDKKKAEGSSRLFPAPGLNLAFTFEGLSELDTTNFDTTSVQAFANGMDKSQQALSDVPSSQWRILRPSGALHGVFIVTGATHEEVVDVVSLRLSPASDNGWKLLHTEVGQVRPAPTNGHEHFGYADGVSQPGVRGLVAANTPLTPTLPGAEDSQGQQGQDLLWPGEFVFGYAGQNPAAASFTEKGPDAVPPAPFMNNGAFLIFRRLAQLVPEFNHSVKAASESISTTENPSRPDRFGAQLVGRWKSGASLINAPTEDNLDFAEDTDVTNAFEFGGDRTGVTCPFAAHIRKAYPRDDVINNTTPTDEESDKAEAFTQSHRMLRRGIAFGPEVTEHEALSGHSSDDKKRGLLFKCYVTSIEDQFEFVQKTWCNNGNFVQPGSGVDPIIGQSANPSNPFLGAAPTTTNVADKPSINLRSFVHLEGGAYFFAPSLSAVKSL